MSELNGVFYLSVGSLALGGIGLILRFLFKCKCSQIDLCCGLIHFNREVNVELQESNLNNDKSTPHKFSTDSSDPINCKPFYKV